MSENGHNGNGTNGFNRFPNGDSGSGNGDHRDGNGRFAPGNPGGPGRPRSQHRAMLMRSITLADVQTAVSVLRDLMNSADERIRLSAASALLDRSCGKPTPDDLVERVETLETTMGANNG